MEDTQRERNVKNIVDDDISPVPYIATLRFPYAEATIYGCAHHSSLILCKYQCV